MAELEAFLKAAQMDRVGVFTYSGRRRPGYDMPGAVSAREKQRRFKHLMEVQQQISLARNVRHVGETLRVLIDEEVPQSAHKARRREDPEGRSDRRGRKIPETHPFCGAHGV